MYQVMKAYSLHFILNSFSSVVNLTQIITSQSIYANVSASSLNFHVSVFTDTHDHKTDYKIIKCYAFFFPDLFLKMWSG